MRPAGKIINRFNADFQYGLDLSGQTITAVVFIKPGAPTVAVHDADAGAVAHRIAGPRGGAAFRIRLTQLIALLVIGVDRHLVQRVRNRG